MIAARVSSTLRAVRIGRGLRQSDIAEKAGVSRTVVSRVERGHIGNVPMSTLQRIGSVLEVQIDLTLRWRGGDLDRLLNADHAALHESVARLFADYTDWEIAPEVTFAIYGERGVIDVLAWHAASGTVLVMELKTLLVDIHDLIGNADRRRRLARQIAAQRGCEAQNVGVWVALANSRTNRRRFAAHRTVLGHAFPAGGAASRNWLRDPSGPIAALSLWTNVHGGTVGPFLAGRQRVRKRKPSARATQ